MADFLEQRYALLYSYKFPDAGILVLLRSELGSHTFENVEGTWAVLKFIPVVPPISFDEFQSEISRSIQNTYF